MTEQELREQIGIEIAVAYRLGINTQPISVPVLADNIFKLIKEASYKSPEEIRRSEFIWQQQIEHAREGYVKLADDQDFPTDDDNLPALRVIKHLKPEIKRDLLKAGWRRIEK